MIKRSPLRPSSLPIARRKAPKKKARSKAERLRIYGPPGYVEWIHEQPCIACGVVGFSEVAHIKTGGMGRKDDWTRTVPLCGRHLVRNTATHRVEPFMGCHRYYDEYPLNFAGSYQLDMGGEARRTNLSWQSRISEKAL